MTVLLAPPPVFKAFDNNGVPLAFGQLFTYVAGTNTPQASYPDSTQTTPNTNPVVLNARGEAPVWLVTTQTYKLVLTDSAGNQIYSVDNVQGGLTAAQLIAVFTQQVLGGILYPQTTAEMAAFVTPTNYWYPPGDVRRYGADPSGTSDSTIPINNALKSNGLVYAPTGTYVCSAPIVMFSGQTFYGDNARTTTLQFANAAINNVTMVGITGATLRSIGIKVTGTTGATVGAVYMLNNTSCRVYQCEFQGMRGGGVFLDSGCTLNIIDSNYFHDFGPGGNFGCIMMYSQASATNGPTANIIVNNSVYGTSNAFGISMEDPDIATSVTGFPRKNLIQGNRVGPHATYGILSYMSGLIASPPFGDTNNQIIGNYVEGIVGNAFGNTDSGAGIYVVGSGIGGTIVADNVVFNCCTNTTTASLAPAGIGISLVHTGVTPPVIANNTISGMTQGHGILIVSSPGGAVVTGNSINMPSSNVGTGPGGSALLGRGIQVNSSSLVTIGPNSVQMFGTGQALYIFASQANMTDINITGGYYSTGTLTGSTQALLVTFSSSFSVSRFNISNTNLEAALTNPAASLAGIVVGSWNNVTANCIGSAVGLNVAGCTNMRFVSGWINSGGAVSVSTSGTCTNSFMSKDCNWGEISGGNGSFMSNAGTGFNVEANFSGVPTAGTWVTGDRAVHLGVVVGSAKAWARVTTGSGNVLATDWISEGNL